MTYANEQIVFHLREVAHDDLERSVTRPRRTQLPRVEGEAELREAIEATTGSARAFAGLIGSDERTVRRWLAGDRAIPGPVLALCRLLIARPKLARLLEKKP